MILKIKGKEYELQFGLKFIRELDKAYTHKVDGMEFGLGVESAIPYLKMQNPTVLFELIKAATSHLKSKPSNNDIEDELLKRAEEGKLEELYDEFLKAMEESAFLKPKLKQINQAIAKGQK